MTLDDGLDEAEVVALALWNNPALRAELTRIDAARATLAEARRPANPQINLLGPIGPVSAMLTLVLPLESLWQLPRRAEAAAREADVIGEAVLMSALDLVRDARLLHVELGLALDRAAARDELARVAHEVARVASVRADVGDVSRMEERVLFADAQASTDTSDVARTDVALAQIRLVNQLSVDHEAAGALHPTFASDLVTPPGLHQLVALARAARPDARSADLAISAMTARAGWERSRVVSFSMLMELHWRQAGPAMRLGGRVELPLFGANPGGIGRADAEIERVTALHEVVARNVVMEVAVTRERFLQATRSRLRFEDEVIPALEAALEVAQHGFQSGDESYLVVLDVLRRTGDARIRRAELLAEQRRARCELDRAVGARLESAADVAARIRQERGGL